MERHSQTRRKLISYLKQVLVRAAILAIIIGSVLTLFNQPAAVFGQDKFQWLPLILSYLTPFLVVGVSQISGAHAARREAGINESFAYTLFSHGIVARAIVLGLAAGAVNIAIITTAGIVAGQSFSQLPMALMFQALTLPIVFGALSQAIAYRRTVKLRSLAALQVNLL